MADGKEKVLSPPFIPNCWHTANTTPLFQEQTKSKKLEDSIRKLDQEMKRTDQLLYQMIPKQVADRLRSGEPSVSTCEVSEHIQALHQRHYVIA